MEVEYTKHALEKMKKRGISIELINDVILKPDQIIDKGDKRILQSKRQIKGKEYLIRVFVNTNDLPNKIITVYYTNKISKYWSE